MTIRYDTSKRSSWHSWEWVAFAPCPLPDSTSQAGYKTLTAKATQTNIIESWAQPHRQVDGAAYIRPHFLDCSISVFPMTCHVRSEYQLSLSDHSETYRPAWPKFSDNVVVTCFQLCHNSDLKVAKETEHGGEASGIKRIKGTYDIFKSPRL